MHELNPLNFTGRLGRIEFLLYSVVLGILVTILVNSVEIGVQELLDVSLWSRSAEDRLTRIALTCFGAGYGVRRLHDFGRNGWWYLLSFVPFVNLLVGLALLLVPGDAGANRFGIRQPRGMPDGYPEGPEDSG